MTDPVDQLRLPDRAAETLRDHALQLKGMLVPGVAPADKIENARNAAEVPSGEEVIAVLMSSLIWSISMVRFRSVEHHVRVFAA